MGWRFRKSIKVMPGVRINLSRRGVGYSVGPRGFKVGRGADGKYRRTVSVPGTGLYDTSVIGSRKKRAPMPQPPHQPQWTAPPNWPQPMSGWAPPPGWQPDPAWGPPPAGWQFWQVASRRAPQQGGALAWTRQHPKSTAAAAVLALLFVIGSLGGGDGGGDGPSDRQDVITLAADREAEQRTTKDAARRAAEEGRAAEEAASAKAVAEAAARAEAERVAAEQASAAAAEAAREAEAARVAAEQQAAAEASARADEQRRTAEAATRAETERRAAEQAATQKAADAAASDSGTDPRFGTCKEAIDKGYGPYYRGKDPEYSWYRDQDNDGVNCES